MPLVTLKYFYIRVNGVRVLALFFTTRRYASAVYAVAMYPYVCMFASVCPTDTSRSCSKIKRRRTTDRGFLFWCQRP